MVWTDLGGDAYYPFQVNSKIMPLPKNLVRRPLKYEVPLYLLVFLRGVGKFLYPHPKMDRLYCGVALWDISLHLTF